MYKLVSTVSLFLRTFIFSNPFTQIFEVYLANSVLASSASTVAEIFNFSVGGTMLCAICYPLVGIIYDRGEAPAVGAILYGVFVLINSKLLVWASQWGDMVDLKSLLVRFFMVLVIESILLFGIRYVKEVYI